MHANRQFRFEYLYVLLAVFGHISKQRADECSEQNFTADCFLCTFDPSIKESSRKTTTSYGKSASNTENLENRNEMMSIVGQKLIFKLIVIISVLVINV